MFLISGYGEACSDAKGVQKKAEHCNDKKTNAKSCSDLSSELYFAVFVKVHNTSPVMYMDLYCAKHILYRTRV